MTSGERTIVIQPGSRFLKIGLARDAFPKVIPHVIARRQDRSLPDVPGWELPAESLKDTLHQRNKQSKKKLPPNIYTSLASYNESAEPQKIPLHNDSYAFEWTVTGGRPFICGKEALRISPEEGYHLVYPIQRGTIDRSIYASFREACEDLESIWRSVIENQLNINHRDLNDYAVMMVVPATASGWEIKAYTETVLNGLGAKAISFISDPVASTFCAGISGGCVIDMGAQTITVCCVEDGSVLPDSLIQLGYGGDDLTRLFYQILFHHNFPYKPTSANLSDPIDFDLFTDLRERLCTLDEEDISSQIYEFFVRRPTQTTLHYAFKVLEERIIPLECLLNSDEDNWLVRYEEVKREQVKDISGQFWSGSYEITGEVTAQTQNNTNNEMDIDLEDDPVDGQMTDVPTEATPSQEETFACQWNNCNSEPFTTLIGIINHIKNDHLQELTCSWNKCGKRFPADSSEVSRLGHIIDHLNEKFMGEKPALESQPTHTEPQLKPLVSLNLFEAVIESLKVSPKNASSVLLVGGLSKTPFLADRLFSHLSSSGLVNSDGQPIPVDFVLGGHSSNVRDQTLDPTFFGWKGGAVASKLDATQEAGWITAEEWSDWGVRMLRERLPFPLV